MGTLSRDLGRAVEEAEARRAAEAALRQEAQRARDEAEASNAAKGSFLARMSHEIRTPMNSVLGLSEVLLGGHLDPQQRQHAELVHRSAGALMDIINEILDLSRIEAVGVDLRPAPVDLRGLVRGVAEMLRGRAQEAGLELTAVLPGDLPQGVEVDPVRLRQVLVNLVGNALKFTPRGWVRVEVSRAGDGLRFEVEDTGIGIAADQLPRLLQPFTQADESAERRYAGTGLGLPISQQIVQAMGGDIEVISEPGRGTRLWFELVLPEVVPAAPEPAASRPRRVEEGRARPRAAAPRATGLDDVEQAHVLVVDDNAANREVASAMLEVLGCTSDQVDSGREALAAVGSNRYAMVLLDCHMPGWSGFRTLDELRRWWKGREVATTPPVVALTADAQPEFRAQCAAHGMDDYLSKPLSMDALGALIARWGVAGGTPNETPSRDPG